MTSNQESSDEDGIFHNEQEEQKVGIGRDRYLNCRMYEEEYPKIGDIVVVEVCEMAEMGAYCTLLEYNNIEGMLLFTELQGKRIRSVKKIIKKGREEIVQVRKLNEENGYIDLSRKRVTAKERNEAKERYIKSKIVHSIMRQVVTVTSINKKNGAGIEEKDYKYSMLELYELFGWEMARKFGNCYEGFKWAMTHWNDFLNMFGNNILAEDVKAALYKNVVKRLRPQLVTVRSNIAVKCFGCEGVNAVKRALKEGLKLSTNELQVCIKLVRSPLFTVSVSNFDHEEAKRLVSDCISRIRDNIEQDGGTCEVQRKAEVIALEN